MKLSRQRKLISRACLMAAASLLAAVPTVRAANIFFDPNGGTTAAVTGQTIGTGGHRDLGHDPKLLDQRRYRYHDSR